MEAVKCCVCVRSWGERSTFPVFCTCEELRPRAGWEMSGGMLPVPGTRCQVSALCAGSPVPGEGGAGVAVAAVASGG